jgi:hypothetical protein
MKVNFYILMRDKQFFENTSDIGGIAQRKTAWLACLRPLASISSITQNKTNQKFFKLSQQHWFISDLHKTTYIHLIYTLYTL